MKNIVRINGKESITELASLLKIETSHFSQEGEDISLITLNGDKFLIKPGEWITSETSTVITLNGSFIEGTF
jgi:uncharacterized protein YlzI (FlbEa/FlbD family)